MPAKPRIAVRNTSVALVQKLAAHVKAEANHWNAYSIRSVLTHAYLWDRLVREGYAMPVDAANYKEATPEEKRKALLEEMYRKGMRGDVVAQKSFIEMSQAVEVKSAFDVSVGIVDYRIADKSLKGIVMDADEKPLGEILKAVVDRCRIDGFSHAVTKQMEQAFLAFVSEAEVKFKDADNIPRVSGITEEDAYSDVDPALVDAKLEKMMAEV